MRKAHLRQLIPRLTFILRFRLLKKARYLQFIRFISDKIEDSLDKETQLLSLSIKKQWHDQGWNIHTILSGKIRRRNECADIVAEIVWLKKLKIYRGKFYSSIHPKLDSELLAEAKSLFHNEEYEKFLYLSKNIQHVYSKNKIFNKMLSIAKRHSSTVYK